MKRLGAAIAFLTRVPIRTAFTTEDVGRSALVFPAVGAAIGLAQLGIWKAAGAYLPPLVLAVLVVAFAAWVTRALHLDGLADFVDGLGGGRTREDALRIMKDSRIGAFGTIALVLVLGVKIVAIPNVAAISLVLAPALSRWSIVVLGHLLPYARPNDAPSLHIGKLELAGATFSMLALAVLAPRLASFMAASVIVVSLVVGRIAKSRLGGVTGDVLGANLEIAEAAALVVAA